MRLAGAVVKSDSACRPAPRR